MGEQSEKNQNHNRPSFAIRLSAVICASWILLLFLGSPLSMTTPKVDLLSIPKPERLRESENCNRSWAQFVLNSKFQADEGWVPQAEAELNDLIAQGCFEGN